MICFDVTIKGYSKLEELIWANPEADDSLNNDKLADETVKWVVAPSQESLNKFIERNQLQPILDGPYDMKRPESLMTHEDGVDIILDEEGNIVSQTCEIQSWFDTARKVQEILANEC